MVRSESQIDYFNPTFSRLKPIGGPICPDQPILISSLVRTAAQMGFGAGPCGSEGRKVWYFSSSGRTFPVVFNLTQGTQTHYDLDATGGGRSSALIRRMSAKMLRVMATSAICNAT